MCCHRKNMRERDEERANKPCTSGGKKLQRKKTMSKKRYKSKENMRL